MANVFGRLAVIALLVFAGVTLWYGRVEKKMQGMIPAEKKQTAALPVQAPGEPVPVKYDYQVILNRNIFKAALDVGEKPASDRPSKLEDLQETGMQLVLLGTVSGSKEDARAVIRDEKSKREDLYRVGGQIQGATITRIGRGKVALQVNGREEVLNIKDALGRGQKQAQAASPQVQTNPTSEGQVPEAQPRGRINFRNTAESAPPPPDTEVAPPDEQEQEQQADSPAEDVPPPESGENANPEGQQAQ